MTVTRTINSSKVTNNPLVPRYIKEDISKTVGAMLLMQTYATRILQELEFSLNIDDRQATIRNLTYYQIIFKQYANHILDSLIPSITPVIFDINSYAVVFDTFHLKCLQLTPDISAKEDTLYRFIFLLDKLEVEAERRKADAQHTLSLLHDFKAQFNIDKENFNWELKRINKNIMPNHYLQKAVKSTDIALANSVAENLDLVFEITNYIIDCHKAIWIEWSSIITGIRSFKQEIVRASNMSNTIDIGKYLNFANREWEIVSQRAQEMVVRLVSLRPEEVSKVLNWSNNNSLIPSIMVE